MAAAANDLLLTDYELPGGLDLNDLGDAEANMTPVADGASGNTFRFNVGKRTLVLLRNAHSAAVTFTISGPQNVNVAGYGEVDMPNIAVVLGDGSVTKQIGVVNVPTGYATDGIVSVAVTYTGDAADGSILAGSFKLTA